MARGRPYSGPLDVRQKLDELANTVRLRLIEAIRPSLALEVVQLTLARQFHPLARRDLARDYVNGVLLCDGAVVARCFRCF